ncbi:hypothetical protein DSO57_1016741 [Entomophthora muscae]|uniref:Uncharacterized protein n=1 Tax=Entomophthora muscae TaxID=34485 RepID=A0ACC2TS22_9FUNG|nr:hypothetical protein DSO57_1016741 [Entomophthora muscae]
MVRRLFQALVTQYLTQKLIQSQTFRRFVSESIDQAAKLRQQGVHFKENNQFINSSTNKMSRFASVFSKSFLENLKKQNNGRFN